MSGSTRIDPLSAWLAFVVLAMTADAAGAQSFLQQLFGSPGSVQRHVRGGVSPASQGSGEAATKSQAPTRQRLSHESEPEGGADAGQRKYRTMCVRLCDGYYFPISEATTHRAFLRDASACETSCGSEARLFYMPAGETDAATMTDLTGLGYPALANAFKYRKTLVSGCACKPMPWSEAARARHQSFARAEDSAQRTAGRGAPGVALAEPVIETPREPLTRYPLPPPFSGPGVAVISANGVAVMAETEAQPEEAADADAAYAAVTEAGEADVRGVTEAEPPPVAARAWAAAEHSETKAARRKVTILNASAQDGRVRIHKVRSRRSGSASGLVVWPFSTEPRRIYYGQ